MKLGHFVILSFLPQTFSEGNYWEFDIYKPSKHKAYDRDLFPCLYLSLKHQKKFLSFEGARTLEKAAQRGFGVSLSRDFKNPPGHIPVQPILINPALAGVGLD